MRKMFLSLLLINFTVNFLFADTIFLNQHEVKCDKKLAKFYVLEEETKYQDTLLVTTKNFDLNHNLLGVSKVWYRKKVKINNELEKKIFCHNNNIIYKTVEKDKASNKYVEKYFYQNGQIKSIGFYMEGYDKGNQLPKISLFTYLDSLGQSLVSNGSGTAIIYQNNSTHYASVVDSFITYQKHFNKEIEDTVYTMFEGIFKPEKDWLDFHANIKDRFRMNNINTSTYRKGIYNIIFSPLGKAYKIDIKKSIDPLADKEIIEAIKETTFIMPSLLNGKKFFIEASLPVIIR